MITPDYYRTRHTSLKALDLYCGAGGASIGLWQSGFGTIVGIDNNRNCGKRYPFDFVLADALSPPLDLGDFDFIWASPPCEGFSVASKCRSNNKVYADLLTPTRDMIEGHPCWVIENVPGAPMRPDIVLTGPAVGLPNIERKRYFELASNFYCESFALIAYPTRVRKERWDAGEAITVTTSMCSNKHFYKRKALGLPGRPPSDKVHKDMGVPQQFRMTMRELGRAVPPAYAKVIGDLAMRWLTTRKEGGIDAAATF